VKQQVDSASKRRDLAEPLLFLGILFAICIVFCTTMGLGNFVNTLMNTAYSLLVDTVLYLTAIAVLSGALSALLSEFGVVSLLNRLISPLMYFVYRLPGASVLGIVSSYLSDNPAILPLAQQPSFRQYFEPWQIPALTNLGTSFGMGLIITLYVCGMKGSSGSFLLAALVGNLGAVIGSIVSVRLMLLFTCRAMSVSHPGRAKTLDGREWMNQTVRRSGGVSARFLNAMIDGGKAGVQMGISIIPGVLLICSFVMLLTNGMPEGGYTGAAGEGIALLPWIGQKLQFIFRPLFGFLQPDGIAVPITAIGSAGAAISLVPTLLEAGKASVSDVAVFTAMSMCWSGYLSTHTAMMDTLGCQYLTGKAILAHTVGGIVSGVAARWIFALASIIV